MAAIFVYMALLGGARGVLGGGAGMVPFVVVTLALSTAMWFTAWLMLKGAGATSGAIPQWSDHGDRHFCPWPVVEPKRLFAVAGRLVRGGRRLRLRLAERWPWNPRSPGATAG